MAIVVSFIILAVIAFGLWYFERLLASKPNRNFGLIMPIGFPILSLISMVQAIPIIFEDLEAVGGVSGAIFTVILSFIISNIATVWVYIVYFLTRKKMGERPWPLRPIKENNEDSQND